MSLLNNTTNLQSLLEQVNALPEAGGGGTTLPNLSNEGTASDLLSGKQLINSNGNVVTGTIPSQAAKTITPKESSQTAVASGVYTTGTITVGAIPSAYENVGTETSTYTTELSELAGQLSVLESALEGKAAGGGGSSSGGIKTCTVRISDPLWTTNAMAYYVSIIDEEFYIMREIIFHESEFKNVPCNSDMYIDGSFDNITVNSEDSSSYYDGYQSENWSCYRVYIGTSDTLITFA